MILLTGASGFIGRYLLHALIERYGRESVAALSSKPIEGVATVIRDGVELPADIFERQGFGRISSVIHAGAFSAKSAAQGADWQGSNTNITHTQSLLNALPAGLERFINISTLDVYGPCSPISESCPIAPGTMYGLSKYYCERMVEAWASTSGATIQNLRLGHIYGPGEEAYKKIIPESFRRLLAGQALQQWGDGTDLRSFVYIDDTIAAIMKALELEKYEGPINIVGGTAVSIGDLVQLLIEVSGASSEIVRHPAAGPRRDLVFDNAKMRQLLGDEAMSLREGLSREWQHMKALHEQHLL